MSLTRGFLKSMGLTEEQVGAIMEEHIGVTDALKKQRDEYKAEAEKLPEVQKQLDEARGGEDFRAKYDDEHKAFEDYKAKVAAQEQESRIKAAYRKLLTDCNISDKRLDAICKVTDFSGMKLDKDGNLTDAEALTKAIKADWADFVAETHKQGVPVETPPQTNAGGRTKAEILAIKDTAERQQAIAENHTLFGF